MSYPLLQKITGVLTATALCAISMPTGLAASAAQPQLSDPAIINEIADATPRDQLSMFAYLSLLAHSYQSAGYADNFLSEQNQLYFDADFSGAIDMTDAYLFLYWDSYHRASGSYLPETEAFFAHWNISVLPAASTSTIEFTMPSTTETSETTTTTTTDDTTFLSSEETTVSAETTLTTPESTVETAFSTVLTESTTTSTTGATTIISTAYTTATTQTSTTVINKTVYDGIDVSKYQGNVNWSQVKKDGTDFAIIRAGYGKYASQKDPYFDQNMKNAKAAGIACGAYWFSYAESVADAKKEAEVFASIVSGYQFEYPLVFDIEAEVHTKMTKEQVSAIITAFCDTMESKGYYVALYSYSSFLNNKVYDSVLQKYDIWVAHFNVSAPTYSKTPYGMWQYSSTGRVGGITGDVDLDYSYRNYPPIMKRAHLNGY